MNPRSDAADPTDRPAAAAPEDEGALASLGRAITQPMRDAAAPDEAELDAIDRDLQRGLGRERVTDANVEALIARAKRRGDAQTELLLREWRSPCGDDPDAPPASALRQIPPP